MAQRKSYRLHLKEVGPIAEADVKFGDLTVIVGPQATGKSIFLQTLKLLMDRDSIHDTFRHYNVSFNGNSEAFLGGYYGKGMAGAWKQGTSKLFWNGKECSLLDLTKASRAQSRTEHLFFIPAQRVMSLANGVTQNFGQFNYGDPYTLRYFSDTVHDLLQNEFGAKGDLFPQPNRLNNTLRKPINEHLYGGSKLAVDAKDFTKRLVLNVPGHKEGLPYTAWSAGQREFTPLLLGLYWLCPAGSTSRREQIEWVVVEEPEMGLHPQGIEAVLLLVLELMQRGYRVVVSTHSPVVLDLVWALQEFKKHGGIEADVRKLLSLDASNYSKKLAQSVLEKDYRVYFFSRGNKAHEISSLSPLAEEREVAEWGGLVGFASRTGEVIADVVNREAAKPRRRRAEAKPKGTEA
ncbi:MAG: AAA family ATPase [Gallionellaceae bacterium]|nr:AAA family ATPase [Gallionellaceae bacterium]